MKPDEAGRDLGIFGGDEIASGSYHDVVQLESSERMFTSWFIVSCYQLFPRNPEVGIMSSAGPIWAVMTAYSPNYAASYRIRHKR